MGELGVINTKREVADFMLDLVGYSSKQNLQGNKLLDPASGDGVFILNAIERLYNSSKTFGFDYVDALTKLRAFEINEKTSETLSRRIEAKIIELSGDCFDSRKIVRRADFLRTSVEGSFDSVVANPPYIRYDDLSELDRTYYRKSFRFFNHRADAYIAFFEQGLKYMSQKGKLCYISPDRWLKNQYGGSLRDHLSKMYGIPVVVNLDGTNPFEDEVLGYPMITLISKEADSQIRYFAIRTMRELKSLANQLRNAPDIRGQTGARIVPKPPIGSIWSLESEIEPNTLEMKSIESQGFRIGIGVATGFDRFFIGKALNYFVEEELLIPIVLSKDIANGKITWSGNYIINPFNQIDGALIELEKFPKAQKYFELNEEKLRSRHVARKRSDHWYRTIDRIDFSLTRKPKLLIPDIKKGAVLALDEGNYYPHHNLYYITNGSLTDLKALGGLFLSNFFKKQMEMVSVRMSGGYLRHQAQNLRKILLPDVGSIPTNARLSLIDAFDHYSHKEADETVSKLIDEWSPSKPNGQPKESGTLSEFL
jgi:hypothetical protein